MPDHGNSSAEITADKSPPLGVPSNPELIGRGRYLVRSIRNLQKREKNILSNMDAKNNRMDKDVKESNQANSIMMMDIAKAKAQMFKELKSNQDFYRNNVKTSHNILTQETDALEIVERELNRARNRIGLIHEQRGNKLRLVEINRYYGDKYQHHTYILKMITLVFALILVLTFLYNYGILPPIVYSALFLIIASVGAYQIIAQLYDAYARDNMYYQNYNWNKLKTPPPKDDGSGSKSPYPSDEDMDAVCVGQECCREEHTWVPQPFNQCFKNVALKEDPLLLKHFGPKGYPKYDPSKASNETKSDGSSLYSKETQSLMAGMN